MNPPSSEQSMTSTAQERPPRRNKANHQRSDMVAAQAMWYIAAFFVTYILDVVAAIAWYAFDSWWYWLDIIAYFILPLQGFFNFCVFIRTRKMKSRLGQFTRIFLCCLEGSKMQKLCCCVNDDDNTTRSGGGGGGSRRRGGGGNVSNAKPCPAAMPPPANNNIMDDHQCPKTTRVLFASPPRSPTSPCCHPDSITSTRHSTSETNKVDPVTALSLGDKEDSTTFTNSRRLDDQD
jgi:hypothetical protein